jgi:hypothetical protein
MPSRNAEHPQELGLNGQRLTSFETFAEAERASFAAGEESRRHGRAVEINVQTATGETNLILRGWPRAHQEGRHIAPGHQATVKQQDSSCSAQEK